MKSRGLPAFASRFDLTQRFRNQIQWLRSQMIIVDLIYEEKKNDVHL